MFILIILYIGAYKASMQAPEFDTLQTCQEAKAAVVEGIGSGFSATVKAFCVKK